MPTKNIDLPKLMESFGTEDRCRAFLEGLRWPDGIECPRCDGTTISRIKKRDQFDCDSCRYQFSVKSGTIFHDSHLPLSKWFLATYIICESKKGVSANQLKRMLRVSYKTAWYLAHRIRAAMADTERAKLDGVVEVDETYIGGKRRGVGRGTKRGKAVVMAAVERDGLVRFEIKPDRTKPSVHSFIRDNVSENAEGLYTDELSSYFGLEGGHAVKHRAVGHGDEEWVRGNVHTNTVEGVFSLLKRSIIGSYHHVSVKHLPAYLEEIAFRYSNRKNEYLFRDTLMRLVGADALPYEELTAKGGEADGTGND